MSAKFVVDHSTPLRARLFPKAGPARLAHPDNGVTITTAPPGSGPKQDADALPAVLVVHFEGWLRKGGLQLVELNQTVEHGLVK